MRRLVPDPGEEDLEDLYLDLDWPPAHDDRPYLFLDMVSSVDGSATADGRTAQLGGAADTLAFQRLREWCDAILIGAGTVRVEGYGPPRLDEAAQRRREQRGLAPQPRIVVVTASLELDPGARLFSDPATRATIVTVEDADPDRLAALDAVADVLQYGSGRVDLARAFAVLRTRGVVRLLCEGGPRLNRDLFAADLVDELFLTIAPLIVGQPSPRIVADPIGGEPRPTSLVELREHEGDLLARFRIGRAGAGGG